MLIVICCPELTLFKIKKPLRIIYFQGLNVGQDFLCIDNFSC